MIDLQSMMISDATAFVLDSERKWKLIRTLSSQGHYWIDMTLIWSKYAVFFWDFPVKEWYSKQWSNT